MKSLCFALLLALAAALAAPAQGMDVVAMVDTSSSMFPYYDELQNYLLRDLLEHWLHKGDTFHLLSFADTPEVEISARISGPKELTAIIDRIYLLRALGRYTDLVAAVDFLYTYLDSLPPDSPKLVLLLTDGVHDPPPDSPNRGDAAQVLEALRKNAQRIRLRGWDIHILRIPGAPASAEAAEALASIAAGESGVAQAAPAAAPPKPPAGALPEGAAAAKPGEASVAAAAGAQPAAPQAAAAPPAAAAGGQPAGAAPNLLEAFAESSGATVLPYSESTPETLTAQLTGFPTLAFPPHLGKVGRRFAVPFALASSGPQEWRLTLDSLTSGRARLLVRPAQVVVPPGRTVELPAEVRLPLGLMPGEHTLAVRLAFAESDVRVSPLEGEISFTFAPVGGLSPLLLYILIGAAALVAAIIVILVLLLLRNRARDRGFARIFAAGAGGQRPIMLKVADQNPYIGTRNIHVVAPGRSLSVGGNGSAFLIYYLPMPRRIGSIRNDGRQYTFIPNRPDSFASLDRPLPDCLNREIVALTSRGQPVRLLFQEYVSPLEQINTLMRSVRKARDQSASSAR